MTISVVLLHGDTVRPTRTQSPCSCYPVSGYRTAKKVSLQCCFYLQIKGVLLNDQNY